MKDKNEYNKEILAYLKSIRIGVSKRDFIRIQAMFTSYPFQQLYYHWYKDQKEWKETKTTLN